MNIETVFPRMDVPMKPGTFIFFWMAWTDYLENLKQSQAMKQSPGDVAISWVMGSMVGGK